MPDLRSGRFGLERGLAVALFPDQTCVRARVAPHDSCREHQGLCQHLRVLDRHIVKDGIAFAPEDAVSPGELLQKADLALYQAKDAGRNTTRFFNPAMQASVDAERVQARCERGSLRVTLPKSEASG